MPADSTPITEPSAQPSLDRRDFVKLAALSAASGVAASMAAADADLTDRALSLPQLPQRPEKPDLPGVTWDKAPCRFCGTGCHVQVAVKDGRVVAIAGDPDADVNKGLLCVKGYHVGMILYGEDRLTTPQIRKNGELEDVSWDEALNAVAKRIMASDSKFGFYGSGQWTIPEGYAAQKFMRAGMANNHLEANARLCMASAVTGYLSTYGVDEPASCFDDLEACDTLILWGNNPAEMHPVLFSRIVDRIARGEKVKIIDIGTRNTRTSEQADVHLLMQPNGDMAIAIALRPQLIENDTYDHDFVSKHCNFRADRNPGEEQINHAQYVELLKKEGNTGLFGEAISFEQYRELVLHYTPRTCRKTQRCARRRTSQTRGSFCRSRPTHCLAVVHGHEPTQRGHRH